MKQEEEEEEEEGEEDYQLIPKADWFTKIICFHADIIYNCILALVSPFTSLYSMASESYRRTESTTAMVESAILKLPSKVTHGSFMLLRKTAMGVLGAVHVCMVLTMVMVLALFLGVGLVQLWVEEPVFMKEKLFFDYTEVKPKAVFTFGESEGGMKKRQMNVPIGHTVHVSLRLLLPESDYNRQIGVFQLTAELLSANGFVMAKSSQPCMLRFRSPPILLLRTFLMSIPLVLGITEETQMISVQILKHKEGYPRTKAIRVTLIPRARTSFLPQLYEAEILINSKLPWTKEVVRDWKWTFYVWSSLYIYIILVMILVCCCRPLLFPITTTMNYRYHDHSERVLTTEEQKEPQTGGDDNIADIIRKWQQRRSKRKAIALHADITETVGSSASSMSVTRDDTSVVIEGEIEDSESVCLGL